MDEEGSLVRLYPVPFRLIDDAAQFKKWQWIEARVEKARDDRRPESYRIKVDTIRCDPEPLGTDDGWSERRVFLDKLRVFASFEELEELRRSTGRTLGVVRPEKVLGLEVAPAAEQEWSPEELAKLLQAQQQGGLFDSAAEGAALRRLRKMPHDFYYTYECSVAGVRVEHRHKIVDWEACALYWNVKRRHGPNWEAPFRAKLEQELPAKDLLLLLGTIHRFPDKWLIVSLLYPPRRSTADSGQLLLFPPKGG